MTGPMPLSLIGSLAAGQASSWLARAKRKALFLALAALLALTAWALVVAAGVAALAGTYGIPVAALAAAGSMLVLIAAAYAVMRVVEWRQRRRLREEQDRRAAMLATFAAVALPSMIRNRPLLALALVGGGGLLASRYLAGDRE